MIILGATLMLAACGGASAQKDPEVQPVTDTVAKEPQDMEEPEYEEATVDNVEEQADDETAYPTLPLPAYHYYGPEDWAEYADAVCQFQIENTDGSGESDLATCTPIVVKVDDSDPSDVKLWGEFWVDRFRLVNTSLCALSGGSYPGVAHLDTTNGGPIVTGMDYLEDGSDFQPSLDRLFGKEGLADAYLKACDERNEYRVQALSYYLNHNGLYITQYQDYGWPPVPIPNAPPTDEADEQVHFAGSFDYTAEFDMRQVCALGSDDVDMFSNVNSDDWNEFLIEIYTEKGSDIDAAITNLSSNLFDDSVDLTRTDNVTFGGVAGCTSLVSEGPYEDGAKVYVNYLVPREGDLLVVKISSDYSKDEEKQMATDGIIEAFLGNIALQ